MIFSNIDPIFNGRWDETRCLDIACNEGYFGFELCKRGAKEVIGFDQRAINIEKANFVKNYFDYSNIKFFVDDIYNLRREKYGEFDITLCLGIIYHLENPILALRRVREVTKQYCIIDTQTLRFDPSKEDKNEIETTWGTDKTIWKTESVFGIFEEPNILLEGASTTGLTCVPNKAALFKILKYVGFSDVILVEPPENAFEQYANKERVIIIAKV